MLQEMENFLPSNFNADKEDKWIWHFNGNNEFSVASIRKFFDHQLLPSSPHLMTRWNRFVPKKINLFVWRLRRDCLPTSINLFAKGIDVGSIRCVNCDGGVEYTKHVFQDCIFVKRIKVLLNKWTKCVIPDDSMDQILYWCDSLNISVAYRKRLQAIIFIWWWHIWKARNNAMHNNIHESSSDVFNTIVATSYLWIHNRDRKDKSSWDKWSGYPLG